MIGIQTNSAVSFLLREIRRYATKPRLLVEMEEQLSKRIEAEEIKPRKHPGVMKTATVVVPPPVVNAFRAIIKDKPVKTLRREAAELAHFLHHRHPPSSVDKLQDKATVMQMELEARLNVDPKSLSEEQAEKYGKWCQRQVMKELRHRTYNWQPVIYDDHKCLLYVLARFSPEYAVVHRILSEIKRRDSEFQPCTLFDFGSGAGTVTWAARSVWGDGMKEFFNVDSSGAMNDLASLLLRDGIEEKDMPLKGVFYRQFLPASQTLKYDLVVSAYTLLELPSAESRLQTLVNLWNKTHRYLVLVEHGTNAGFQLINEARDFLLELTEHKKSHVSVPFAHIFSPCPHDLPCPRIQTDNTPCNFEVNYIPLTLTGKNDAKKERYSYVVLKKGVRPVDDIKWPRIVREPLVRRKHTVCRMCTAAGKLEEIVFTASKHGKIPYRCARSSNWGDLLPVTLKQPNSEENSCDKPENENDK